MERRTVIVYSIFVMAVIYGAYFHFLSADGDKGRASLDSSKTDVSGPVTIATVANIPTQSAARQAVGEDNEEKWGGDPFRNDRKYRKSPAPKSVKKIRKVKKPQLSAISMSEGGAMAVVDGRIVAVGEKVGSWRLIEVTENAARFEGQEGSIWVRLGGSK